jgi:pyruvate,water dikinase
MGKATGRVKICKTMKDIEKFEAGYVLVASMTRPEFVPAMKKAVGVVTDEGGITSHAAVISRELGVPCVIGARIATKILRDGDLVEVNANHAQVRIIERAR